LNYTNGIGAQQFPGMEEAAASNSVGRTSKAGSTAAAAASQNTPGSARSMDEATLSSAANLVGQALSGNDVRVEKVAALQQSITAGTYSVSSSDVADSILRNLVK
jgi:flagellar biosynthesis anti-sigma factor FlgM